MVSCGVLFDLICIDIQNFADFAKQLLGKGQHLGYLFSRGQLSVGYRIRLFDVVVCRYVYN